MTFAGQETETEGLARSFHVFVTSSHQLRITKIDSSRLGGLRGVVGTKQGKTGGTTGNQERGPATMRINSPDAKEKEAGEAYTVVKYRISDKHLPQKVSRKNRKGTFFPSKGAGNKTYTTKGLYQRRIGQYASSKSTPGFRTAATFCTRKKGGRRYM